MNKKLKFWGFCLIASILGGGFVAAMDEDGAGPSNPGLYEMPEPTAPMADDLSSLAGGRPSAYAPGAGQINLGPSSRARSCGDFPRESTYSLSISYEVDRLKEVCVAFKVELRNFVRTERRLEGRLLLLGSASRFKDLSNLPKLLRKLTVVEGGLHRSFMQGDNQDGLWRLKILQEEYEGYEDEFWSFMATDEYSRSTKGGVKALENCLDTAEKICEYSKELLSGGGSDNKERVKYYGKKGLK
jgi:hypothetical protein